MSGCFPDDRGRGEMRQPDGSAFIQPETLPAQVVKPQEQTHQNERRQEEDCLAAFLLHRSSGRRCSFGAIFIPGDNGV